MEETEEASEETEEIESLEEIEETSDLHEEVSTGRPSLLLKSRISMTSLLWESLPKKRERKRTTSCKSVLRQDSN